MNGVARAMGFGTRLGRRTVRLSVLFGPVAGTALLDVLFEMNTARSVDGRVLPLGACGRGSHAPDSTGCAAVAEEVDLIEGGRERRDHDLVAAIPHADRRDHRVVAGDGGGERAQGSVTRARGPARGGRKEPA